MRTKILLCSYSYHTQKFHLDRRLQTYFFRIQTEGCCQVLLNGTMTWVNKGDLLLYKPGDTFEMLVSEYIDELGQRCISSGDYFVFCLGDWVDQWWNTAHRPQKIRIQIDDRLISVWRQLILEKRRFLDENTELSDYLLRSICLLIDRAIKETESLRGKPFTALRMKQFIEEHASQPFKVGDVANHVGLSVSRAQHLFKECYGKSMIQYAMDIRLALALERMNYSKLTLNQIAESSGFGSYAYFHRVFRERFGMSPSQYLQNLGGESGIIRMKK